MKKICFLVSHLGSGSSDLVEILNNNSQCVIAQSEIIYKNLQSLDWMSKIDHKCRDSSAIYGDHILYNMSISSKCFYNFCKFIYIIRPARATLNKIVYLNNNYTQKNATNYYCFRLRRICEMAKRTKDSIFLTWEDFSSGKAFDLIEKYLDLRTALNVKSEHFNQEYIDSFDENLLNQAQDAYERYYYYMKKIKDN